jgi:hypothetical protein
MLPLFETRGYVALPFYYAALPAWVEAWNRQRRIEAWGGQPWSLLRPRDRYRRADADDRTYERDLYGLGRIFPHPLPGRDAKDLPAAITCTPMGDELTLDFVLALLAHERLGTGAATDLLAVSFSSTDMIGHIFGPDSLEAEDNLLRPGFRSRRWGHGCGMPSMPGGPGTCSSSRKPTGTFTPRAPNMRQHTALTMTTTGLCQSSWRVRAFDRP